ncbi:MULTISPECIES: BMC domain-containing protein [unclassified Granulicatella]|uniref:BMC domain-containing protein n=1 Tax=unclassified Granulicatella TaxID=2630493 RepID=UPI0010742CD0|nr:MULTISPECIES: BMC domain-containing protein [unclassified Granulicatella]MBF0780122.1 BMC domain-containing protein [Granulicatella sp. 19428wC4_WM01]TFU95788.1 BMC domain-containing protein [Granulicatella sp. WM01]
MAGEALGLIEVRGMLGAVVAADAALKAANVTLLNIEPVKAGLRTVQLNGDVGAIRAAVDAAVAAVADLDCYLASHVIARVDEQTKRIYGAIQVPQKEIIKEDEESVQEIEEVQAIELIQEEIAPSQTTENLVQVDEIEDSLDTTFTREELEKMRVVKLREIAYRTEGISLTKKQIKFGNKQTLIDALLKK